MTRFKKEKGYSFPPIPSNNDRHLVSLMDGWHRVRYNGRLVLFSILPNMSFAKECVRDDMKHKMFVPFRVKEVKAGVVYITIER